ncbi:unnamed protein product [Caenorhabditis auriculariae]|uniref:PBZ-type domain-containing protein n=1 Tax=Caenorhabditis auriculariae TaxID=2777116 RepID=A0A8S1HHG1_9PELO|nr:unnamed protein product [Caenorhabditis auriculariae]
MPACKHGKNCYRKNLEHLKEFHPDRHDQMTGGTGLDKKEEDTVGGGAKSEEAIEKWFKAAPKKRQKPSAKAPKKEERENDPKVQNLIDAVTAESPSPKAKKAKIEENPNEVNSEWIPEIARRFWEERAKILNPEAPLDCLSSVKSARLAGPFRILNGEKVEDPVLLDRFLTDLPEMQTFLTHSGGRYAFWRDDPKTKEPFIVHAESREFFPKLEVVGDRIEHAIVHLCGREKASEFLPSEDVGNILKEMKVFKAKRNKIKLGSSHDVGIWVSVVEDRGYRPLAYSAKEMKKMLETIRKTEDEALKKKFMQNITRELNNVHIANDEIDFGTGIEFGHWLFLANIPQVENMCKVSLTTSYKLLGRHSHIETLEKTLKLRKSVSL